MAVDIHTAPTGTTQYVFYIRPSDGAWWNTAGTPAFEAFNGANYTDYDTAATEFGTTGIFQHTVPSALPTGVYYQGAKTRAGGSPAQGDTVTGIGLVHWNGSAIVPLSGVAGGVWDELRASHATANTFGEYAPANVTHWKGTAAATVDTAGYPVVTVKDGTGAGEINTASGVVQAQLANSVAHGGSAATLQMAGTVLNSNRVVRVAANGTVTYYTPSSSSATDVGAAVVSAYNAASSGDTIHVYQNMTVDIAVQFPGGDGMAKDGVDWVFGNVTVRSTDGVLFQPTGDYVFNIYGRAKFVGDNAAILFTSSNAFVTVECDSMTTSVFPYVMDLEAGTWVVKCNRITGGKVGAIGTRLYIEGAYIDNLAESGSGVSDEYLYLKDVTLDTRAVTGASITLGTGTPIRAYLDGVTILTKSGSHSISAGSAVTAVVMGGGVYYTSTLNNVTLSYRPVTLADGAVTAAAVATGAIDADALAPDAGTEIGTAVWASATRTLTSLSGLSVDLTAAAVDAIWDELLSGHTTAGSAGAALTLASAGGGDPLSSTVPGSYAQGTAGYALGRIGSGQITTVSPVAQSGEVSIVQGDAYTVNLGRALEWTDADDAWPTLTDAVITLEVGDGEMNVVGTVVTATGTGKKVRAEPLGTDTALLGAGTYDFNVVATFAGTGTSVGRDDRVTLVSGNLYVTDRET